MASLDRLSAACLAAANADIAPDAPGSPRPRRRARREPADLRATGQR